MNFKLSEYMLISESLDGQDKLQSKRLVFSTRKGMGVTLSNYVISLMQSGSFDALPDNIFNILMYHELVIPDDEVELDEVIRRARLTAADINHTQRVFYLDADVRDEDADGWLEELIGSGFLASGRRRLRKKLVFVVDTGVQDKAAGLLAGIRERVEGGEAAAAVQMEVHLLHRHKGVAPVFLPGWTEGIAVRHIHLLWDLRGCTEDLLNLQQASVTSLLTAVAGKKTGVDMLLLIDPKRHGLLAPLFREISGLVTGEAVRVFLNWEEGEGEEQAALLPFLQGSALAVELLPGPAFTYRGRQIGPSLTPSGKIVWDQTLLPVHDHLPVLGNRRPYDPEMEAFLREGGNKCASCVYLPLCGGKLDKVKEDDRDCPPFAGRFLDKVKLKYQIPL